jgi:hypothetical protein
MMPVITAKTPRTDNHSANTETCSVKKNPPVSFPQTPQPVSSAIAPPAIQAAGRRSSKLLPTPIAVHPSVRRTSNCSPPFQMPPVQVPAASPHLGRRRRTSPARPSPQPVTISDSDDERPSMDIAVAPHMCRRRHRTSQRVPPPLTSAANDALPVVGMLPPLTSAAVAADRPQRVLQTPLCPSQGRCHPATAIQLKVLCART